MHLLEQIRKLEGTCESLISLKYPDLFCFENTVFFSVDSASLPTLSYNREHFSNADLSDLRIVGTCDIIQLLTNEALDMM